MNYMDGTDRQPGRTFRFILIIVAVALAAIVGLSAAFWAIGLIFHLLGWAFRIAFLAAVAAVVWHFVNRRLNRSRY